MPAYDLDLVLFPQHLQRLVTSMTQREEKMSPKKSEAQRVPVKAAALAQHYRAIGPAAIVAALICSPKRKAPTQAAPKAA